MFSVTIIADAVGSVNTLSSGWLIMRTAWKVDFHPSVRGQQPLLRHIQQTCTGTILPRRMMRSLETKLEAELANRFMFQ